ncbi:MAG: redoxin domain-containing protein [Bacteroidales bacterium]|nr:redoxin domain-containing protein [Bacteroidales bacterium]
MHRILSILIIALLMLSCNREKKGIIYIEGKQHSVKDQKVYLTEARYSQGYTRFYKALDSTRADKEGKYAFEVTIRGSDFYQLRNENEHLLWGHDLFLKPGDTIQISETGIHANSLETTEINEFPERLSKEFPHRLPEWIKMKPRAFNKTINKRFKEISEYTDDYFATLDVPSKAVKRYKKENIFHRLNLKLNYLENHNYYSYGEWYPMPLDSLRFSKPVQSVIQDTSWYYSHTYQELIKNYVSTKYYSKYFNPLDARSDKRSLIKRKEIIDRKFHGKVRDIALASLANDFWRYLPAMQDRFFEDIEKILEYFKKVKTTDQFYDFYEEMYFKYKRIEPGNPAPGFTLRDSSGQHVSLNHFYGDFVYITFWNTMNRVFTSNLDKYRSLSSEIGDYDNISLVYIAMQPDNKDAESAWKYFLKTYPFGKHHLIAPGQMNNKEIQPYLIEALPTHVLIDPEGIIITPRAPGPDKITETIFKIMNSQLKINPSS